MATGKLRPIYEWRWVREGHPDHKTRSTRTAGAYRRFAKRLGGEVTRHRVGFRFPLAAVLDAEDIGILAGTR